jgi:hypothetical protein
MKHSLAIVSLLAMFFAANVFAQDSLQLQQKKQHRYKSQSASMNGAGNVNQSKGYVDANGDGYNDNAQDLDGDGIPNGQDADYAGAKSRKGNSSKGFVDADGDGINDNALDADGDGIPNGQDADYVKPADGTGKMNKGGQGKGKGGLGNGSGIGTGDCDGTGPKGNGKRGGK